MRFSRATVASCAALSLALSGFGSPAFARGLVPTERVAATPPARTVAPSSTLPLEAQRSALAQALVHGGVEAAQADARVAALSDAEITRLFAEFDSAPAGGLWFVPFLVVAAMIGMLIGSRDAAAPGPKASSDLFGRPAAPSAP